MEDTTLNCCVTVEWLNSQAVTMKKISYKNAIVRLIRNDLREIFVEVTQTNVSSCESTIFFNTFRFPKKNLPQQS